MRNTLINRGSGTELCKILILIVLQSEKNLSTLTISFLNCGNIT